MCLNGLYSKNIPLSNDLNQTQLTILRKPHKKSNILDSYVVGLSTG
jgi:hypothetical protein